MRRAGSRRRPDRRNSSGELAPVPAALFNYDANDRFTAGDTYDNNGNTISYGGIGNVYDFENHLIQQGGLTIKYDGDGNRIFKTVAGVTTGYLLDDRTPTGYIQVLDEVQGGGITRSYVYGLELIEQDRINSTRQSTSYNIYDGHGSVRALTDLTGAVTDTYDYDAFGNLIHSTGTTPNVYLYSGGQLDPDLHLYYNRARYLNVTTGRFWSIDTYEGDPQSPLSLHKYLYADGVDRTDPSGHLGLEEIAEVAASIGSLATRTFIAARTIITSVYLLLGPAIPVLVERAAFWLAVGGTAVYLASRTPTALRQLSLNIRNYQSKFPAGPGSRGNAVGNAAGQNLGQKFPVFDNFDWDTGEGTQIFSTTKTSTPDRLLPP